MGSTKDNPIEIDSDPSLYSGSSSSDATMCDKSDCDCQSLGVFRGMKLQLIPSSSCWLTSSLV
jgi:hypothetical protein